MSMIRLCQSDPLLNALYEIFGANIVRVPDARIQPLAVVAHRGGRSFFRGDLLPLLDDPRPIDLQPDTTALSDLSGRRSRRVALDLGLHLLRGFLRGFGLPGADLESALGGSSSLAFTFPAIRRVAVDVNALGLALAGRALDPRNPAAAIFCAPAPYDLLLIDAALTSAQLAVVISRGAGQGLGFDLTALRRLAAEIGATLNARHEAEVELLISSPHALTFAFSCVRLFLDPAGMISTMPPDHGRRTLGAAAPGAQPPRAMLSAGPGLLAWDG